MDKFKCPMSNCESSEYFEGRDHYKKHLKKVHKKYLCDLCLLNSTLLTYE